MANYGVLKPLRALNGSRFLGVAKITIGSGGMPTAFGIPGLSISRAATGVYSLAFPPMRDCIPDYGVTRATGASGIHRVLGLAFDFGRGISGSGNTGTALIRTCGTTGAAQDPVDSDQLSIWFYATDSDAG